jgi:uncharacterized protein (TIGR03437 family)
MEGGPIREDQFSVRKNPNAGLPDGTEISFDIRPETQGNSWLTIDGQTSGRGLIPATADAASVRFQVDPKLLSVGLTKGFIHIYDRSRQGGKSVGADSIEIDTEISPRPAELSVSMEALVFSSEGGAGATPASRTLPVRSTGAEFAFSARPLTTSGGNWLLLNAGTTEVTATTPSDLIVSVAASGLAPATYRGSIQITPAGGSPIEVPVQVTVAADVTPQVSQNGVKDAAGGGLLISPGSWASIYGTLLAPDTSPPGRMWRGDEIVNGRLPLSLDGVSVTIGGRAAPVYFVSSEQINVQVPSDVPLGNNVAVVVTTSRGAGPTAYASVQEYGPGLFVYGTTGYVAAQHADYRSVGPPSLFPNGSFAPAQPGETIIIYCTGFGPTDPAVPSGVVVSSAARVSAPVTVTIGGVSVQAEAYLSGAGLYQLNVAVPAALADGDHLVVAEVGGMRTQDNVVLTVRR